MCHIQDHPTSATAHGLRLAVLTDLGGLVHTFLGRSARSKAPVASTSHRLIPWHHPQEVVEKLLIPL
jgi:hypothetical protein